MRWFIWDQNFDFYYDLFSGEEWTLSFFHENECVKSMALTADGIDKLKLLLGALKIPILNNGTARYFILPTIYTSIEFQGQNLDGVIRWSNVDVANGRPECLALERLTEELQHLLPVDMSSMKLPDYL